MREPPALNAVETKRLSVVALLIAAGAAALLAGGSRVMSAILVVLLIATVMRRRYRAVFMLVAGAVFFAGVNGGLSIHLVPILVTAAASIGLAAQKQSKIAWLPLLAATALAGLASVVMSQLVLRPRGRGRRGGAAGEPFNGAPAEPGSLLRRLDALLDRIFGQGESGSEAQPQVRPPDDPVDWLRLLLIVAVVVVVAALIWLLTRWWRARRSRAGWVRLPLVERFDAVGDRMGRPRKPSEGVLGYGAELSGRGDERPGDTGTVLSRLLYDPSFAEADPVVRGVAQLEDQPPQPVVEKTPIMRRALTRLRRRREKPTNH